MVGVSFVPVSFADWHNLSEEDAQDGNRCCHDGHGYLGAGPYRQLARSEREVVGLEERDLDAANNRSYTSSITSSERLSLV